MRKDKSKSTNKKNIWSVGIVLIISTVLVIGVWQLVVGGIVPTDLEVIDLEVIDEQVEILPSNEEASIVKPLEKVTNIQAHDDLNRIELYKGINQYKQTGFIPLFIYNMKPADNILLDSVAQINVPLMNQKDYRWAFDTYGDDSGNIIAANGCAIVSLAMVDSYFHNKKVDPGEIADWAGLDHYVTYAGTAFTIYEAFGKERGYKVKEFYDFYEAMEEVEAGNPVIVGINPGYFSSVGHVMVIRGYEDGMVYINDPNDDAASQASLVGHDEEYMIQDGIAYWSFSKE